MVAGLQLFEIVEFVIILYKQSQTLLLCTVKYIKNRPQI